MRPAYSRIAWGLALELIDFRIQFFDILPDALGYLLIILGLSGIHPGNRKFTTGQVAAGVLLIISLPRLVGRAATLDLLHPQMLDLGQLLELAGNGLLELVMIYGICMGIREQALAENGQMDLALSALRIWQTVFGLGAVMLIVLPFSLTAELNDMTMFLLLLSLSSFIASLWVIALVRRAGKRLGGDGGEGGEGGIYT